jgi:hypothetical protein
MTIQSAKEKMIMKKAWTNCLSNALAFWLRIVNANDRLKILGL